MTLRHLKIFITVADSGSMTAAAKALFIAQPTVSQAIAELEAHYGIKLFDRLSKRLYITEVGKQLLSYARHIISLFDEMEQAIQNPDNCGIIKIGASITVGSYLLPKLVKEFTGRYPSLQVKAFSKNTREIETLVTQNTVDFGVIEGVVHTSDIVSNIFMDDELVLVCGRSHPLYRRQSISPPDLSSLDFIVREPGSGTRELFENIMAANDIKWHLAWECNGSDNLISAAINCVGVAVISKLLVEDEVNSGQLNIIKVDGVNFKRNFSIVYHKNKYLTNAMKSFFELCYSFKCAFNSSRP